jgi:hypothetical protein
MKVMPQCLDAHPLYEECLAPLEGWYMRKRLSANPLAPELQLFCSCRLLPLVDW